MIDIQSTSRALSALSSQKATPARRAQVREALRSKFEGIQSVAAQVLAAWGGRDSIDTLRSWLLTLLDRPHGLAIRGVAIRALDRCIKSEDTDWVLDLYFTRPDRLSKHEFLPLASAVSPELARPRLIAEARGKDPLNRHAAIKVIAGMPYPDKRALIHELVTDPDPYTRKAAHSILSSLTSA